MVGEGQTDAPGQSKKRLQWRLASKFGLSIGGLLLVVAVGVAILTYRQARGDARSALERKGEAIASTLNYGFAVLLDEDQILQTQRIATNTAMLSSVRSVLLVTRDGKVLASSNRPDVGKQVQAPAMRRFLESGTSQRLVEESNENELVVVQPLYSGKYMTMNTADRGIAGAVEVVLDEHEAEAEARSAALRLLAVILGGYAVLSLLIYLILRAIVVHPLYQLATAADRFRSGDRAQRSQIRTQDEIGLVSEAFDDMAHEVETTLASLEEQVKARTADLAEQVQARTADLSELSRAHEELKASTNERLLLAETVKQLSTPVMRVYREVIVMPLIGTIDRARAAQIEVSLLEGIERYSARKVILDLTGVPVVDTEVAASLVKAKHAAELLGAEIIFVGITSSVAISIIQLGIDFSGIASLTDLQGGLLHALRSMRLKISRAPGPAR